MFTRWVAMATAALLASAALAVTPATALAAAPTQASASGSPGPVKAPPPGVVAAPGAAAAAAAEDHVFHAVTRLDGYTDGAFGSFKVYKPHLADTDSHSLAEMDVEAPSGAGSTSDIVEVGWTVDRGLNGDDAPHLFVFHWVAGNPMGYNVPGFVPQPGAAEKPGDPLVVGSVHKFMIKHYQGNWWIGDNNQWFGRYPDSLWPHLDPQGKVDGSTFTKGFRVQWFGEVSTMAPRPCSQMGTGYVASDVNGAARIDDIGEINGPVVELHVFSDAPSYYTVAENGTRGIRYGGRGACVGPPPVEVPNLIGLTTAEARNAIILAHLKVGTVSGLRQPDCNDHVVSQTPPTYAGPVDQGSLVSFEYAIAPVGAGCAERS
jgi:hypothetical protein